jgi:hypothetical protein
MGAAVQAVFSDLSEISIWLPKVALARRRMTTNLPWRKRRIMPSSQTAVLTAIGAVVLGVSVAACGGSTTAGSSAPVPAAEVSYVTEPADPVPGDPVPAAPAANMAKVSANTASEDAIAATLKAVGVASPKRWAAEVVEYRPYATDDLGLAKLRDNLLKYNPSQKTLDQILSVLRP